MLCVICAATMMSGCIDEPRNSDGFAEGETKQFDFIYYDMEGDMEIELIGDITRDGVHYELDCSTNAYIDGFKITSTAKGRTDNVRLVIQGPLGMGDVSYSNCEGTPLLNSILRNAE